MNDKKNDSDTADQIKELVIAYVRDYVAHRARTATPDQKERTSMEPLIEYVCSAPASLERHQRRMRAFSGLRAAVASVMDFLEDEIPASYVGRRGGVDWLLEEVLEYVYALLDPSGSGSDLEMAKEAADVIGVTLLLLAMRTKVSNGAAAVIITEKLARGGNPAKEGS